MGLGGLWGALTLYLGVSPGVCVTVHPHRTPHTPVLCGDGGCGRCGGAILATLQFQFFTYAFYLPAEPVSGVSGGEAVPRV